MRTTILPRLLLSVLAVSLALPAARAQQEQMQTPLPELGWDDEIPYSVRHAVELAVQEKVGEITEEKNAAGKQFIHPYFSNYVEIRDGRPVTWVTLQRCLDDRMITERIEYVFETNEKGEYELASERKLNETDRSLPLKIEPLELARPAKPFTFEHDQLKLEMDGGTYVTHYIGPHPTKVTLAGKGHVKLTPPDDYQEQFWKRYLDGPVLDADIVGVEIEFHYQDRSFLDLIGWTPPSREPGPFEVTKTPPSGLPTKLVDRYEELTEDEDEIAWTPRGYDLLPLPQFKGAFSISFELADGRRVSYGYNPASPQEIYISTIRKTASLKKETREQFQLVALYPAPETRALSWDEQDRREAPRYVVPNAINARFDIDGDKFIATIGLDLLVAEPTDSLEFFLGGNPTVRFIRDQETGEQLPFLPYRNPYSRIFGFEETINSYRVVFPETLAPGRLLRVELSYNSPKLVYKFDEGFWRISRGGLIPFSRGLGDPAMMSFVLRTKAIYEHIAFGEKAREEVAGDYRYSEWRSPRGVNFPTMIIGQFYEPITAEVDGVTIEGYATRVRNDELSNLRVPRKGMTQEVEKARSAIEGYHKMFGVHYPFSTLRVVSVPAQGYAQSPTSILYMDENLMLPESVKARFVDPRRWESITAHEAAHQWWGGLVSNNNQFNYWFVESLAELSSALYLESVKPGSSEVAIGGWRDQAFRSDDVCAIKDDGFYSGEIFKRRTTWLRYTKGPYAFLMLGEHFGYDKLNEYLRRLLQLHSGDLITTTDLQRVAEQVFGVQLDWYWKQWIRENGLPTIGYEFGSPRQVGDKWVVDYHFTQKIMRGDEELPGKVFRLVLPIHVTTPDGTDKVIRVWMKEADKKGQLELPFRPKGRLQLDPEQHMLFHREPL